MLTFVELCFWEYASFMPVSNHSSVYIYIYISVVTDSKSATESADSSESVRVRIRESFAAVSDGFWSSVCESIFT